MKNVDFLVVGSGFSGSITSMALANSGYSVCMVEKEKHPRFAIGESSTPIADMILRDLADSYDLPFLKKISRYGEWQKYYPEVVCGLKRGFSYYHHRKGESFSTDENHRNELLVAASENDHNSDTNWLRSDVDHFLVKKAVESDVFYIDETTVQKLTRDPKNEVWSIFLESPEEIKELQCKWVIDATGGSGFSTSFFDNKSNSKGFETNSSAIFTHFENVDPWLNYLKNQGLKTSDYPYNPDYSALHQLIDEGWIWMLRFNNDRLSAGLLLDHRNNDIKTNRKPEDIWNSTIAEYPSLNEVFRNSELAESPKQFYASGRLQRRLNRLFGNGWVVMPHTAGFVDPLHSTGIAFTLSGVERLLHIFTSKSSSAEQINQLRNYQDKVYNELSFIDLLVSLSYQTRNHFQLFSASTMLYFIASIRYERSRLKGNIPDTFLCAGEKEIHRIVKETFDEIQYENLEHIHQSRMNDLVENIRKRIEPFNTVGLMDPKLNNMYEHTAVELE